MKSNILAPSIPALAILAPDRLAAQAADAVRELLAEAAAANTTRSYATALRYWAAWFQGRFGQPITLPVPEPAVVQFVVDHLARRGRTGLTWELPPALDAHLIAAGLKQKLGPFKLSTVVHRVAVLSAAHQAHKAANPCEAPAVRQLLKRGRRASVKRGERPHKKTAITRNELEALLSTCDDSLEGLRDKALLLFGFASGGRRRSEIAAADWQDLRRIGEDAFVYRLEHSKTQQAGPSATATPDKPVLGRAGVAMAAWLSAADITEGPLFRRLWGERVGPALSPKAVAAIVQRRALQAGLNGDFGGHSLRSGFITEGGRQGIALPALMALTEHRSVAQAIGYFQAGDASSNPAARLLDL
ncbi:site-specific integrase [Xanthomonas campestris pv. campestris]|uniref:site-specific integrase n=1 Tax=Xanthomonas campestris TaxID=339 RepID=UPI000E0EA3BD|nr:site-specific integrase [Xanthomonas campestris]MEB1199388.1 site-specific integrase [Xanthomonas campestris pv. campestris]MEA9534135.1 site-specific integrase [Xanthomonas campestris]MEB1270035.1 site-specific integrase [Xanthomonas campestris pv. campestris]MEB1282483.1 site-specific integrase [Xanthomonas campestris pv. campestris]MEB1344881.1 site-specific integrase [Xanthomonas campestris pv. campestris]